MKKSLFAVAAATAFTGAAQAQSSVTVYGILDMAAVGYNTRSAAGTSAPVANTTGMTFTQNALSTSRLGFRGTEDLGGGTRAFFTIELGVTPMGQQAINSGASQNRQTFLGLAQKGLGEARIGTQYTVIHDAAAATDPGQLNNMMGNMIYSMGTAGGLPTGEAAGLSYTIRSNNTLMLMSENMSGFRGRAMAIINNANSNQTTATTATQAGGVNNQNGWGLGLDFSGVKNLYVTANYLSLNAKNPYATPTGAYTTGSSCTSGSAVGQGCLATNSNGTPLMFGAGQGSALGTNVKDTQQYYAITYDFGVLKAFAQYVNRKVENQLSSTDYIQRSAQQIGVRGNLTKTIEAWASGGMGKYNAYGSGASSNNIGGFQVGSLYWLSKRTNLYAIYGQYYTSNQSTGTGGYQTTAAVTQTGNAQSGNANNYAIGVRHTF